MDRPELVVADICRLCGNLTGSKGTGGDSGKRYVYFPSLKGEGGGSRIEFVTDPDVWYTEAPYSSISVHITIGINDL
jgi:hypothetical protein